MKLIGKVKFNKWSILTLVAIAIVIPCLLYYCIIFSKNQHLEFTSDDSLKIFGICFLTFWISLSSLIITFKNHRLVQKLFIVTEERNEAIEKCNILSLENNSLLKQLIEQSNIHDEKTEYQYGNIIRSQMETKEIIVDSTLIS